MKVREALIVACNDYEDSGLRRLRSPVYDARGLAQVLSSPAIGDYHVRPLINRPSSVISEEIEDFFDDRRREDLLLLYFSCHGIKDETGRLYFAASDTKLQRLAATGISSVFVNERIERSRAKGKVLLLDCCYSGAFARGFTPRSGNDSVDIKERFGGSGLAVVAASDAMEYAWEEVPALLTLDAAHPSIFTAAVIRGLETGEADKDEDGKISVGDLYDYVFERVRQEMPGQTPTRSELGAQGELEVAKSIQARGYGLLPAELRQAAQNPFAGVRVGAIGELAQLLRSTNQELARSAGQLLGRLLREDSDIRVRSAAEAAIHVGDMAAVPLGSESAPPSDSSEPGSAPSDSGATDTTRTTESPAAGLSGRGAEVGEARFLEGVDLEIGVRWDSLRDQCDVVLRAEAPGGNNFRLGPIKTSIDFEQLVGLRGDEPAYGAALTEMVLGTAGIGPFYLQMRELAEGSNRKLRLRIRIDAPSRYHTLRWESLRDPASREPIATSPNVLFSRYFNDPHWRTIGALPARDLRDLRGVLVVAGPWDIGGYRVHGRLLSPVAVAAELEWAREALGGFQIVSELTFGNASMANIIETLREGLDFLYLVCHVSHSKDIPQLYLENQDGTTDVVDGNEFVRQLSRLERPPTVVMLNTCAPGVNAKNLVSDDCQLLTLAVPLLAAGVAAVVVDVSTLTGRAFSRTFFVEFANHGIVDKAMASARAAIRDENVSWIPVLYSRLRSGRATYRTKFVYGAERTWKSLELAVERRRLTPVLGPGLTDSIFGSFESVARGLAQLVELSLPPYEHGSLAKVTQYLKMRTDARSVHEMLRQQLAREILDRRNRATQDDPVWNLPNDLVDVNSLESGILEIGRRLRHIDASEPHRVLARLPFSVYITTAWTDLLEKALDDRGRSPISETFPWARSSRSTVGQSDPEDVGQSATEEHPLVYHLFGRLEDPSSLVLTEDDHLSWLNAWGSGRDVPFIVKRNLVEQCLFLGYRRSDDWSLRILCQGIKSIQGSGLFENVHVAVLPFPEAVDSQPQSDERIANLRTEIYWGAVEDFLVELWQRIGTTT